MVLSKFSQDYIIVKKKFQFKQLVFRFYDETKKY